MFMSPADFLSRGSSGLIPTDLPASTPSGARPARFVWGRTAWMHARAIPSRPWYRPTGALGGGWTVP